MATIKLAGVVKRFGRTTALRGIDLEVEDGESMVLLGPSGCGKTTTLRIIAGLEYPDEGRVYFDGKDVTELPPRDRDVSMVFQSYALWPHMKVFDNIAFPLKVRKVHPEEVARKVRWAAELLEIDHLLDRYPHQLSGGQRQRVAVARAIVIEPQVLLMDEPLSNLDAILRVKMRSEIKKLQRRLGVTMIYVTHDQVEAMVIGDRITVMNEGMIMQVGSPKDVYERPSNTFVATFIGSPQMNLVEGKLVDGVLEVAGSTLKGVEADYEGKVIVGFRPEKVDLSGQGDLKFMGQVEFVENLGADYIIHIRLPHDTLVSAKLHRDPGVSVGDRVVVSVDRRHVHLFDPASGEAISHGA